MREAREAVENWGENCAFAERRLCIFNKLTALFCKRCIAEDLYNSMVMYGVVISHDKPYPGKCSAELLRLLVPLLVQEGPRGWSSKCSAELRRMFRPARAVRLWPTVPQMRGGEAAVVSASARVSGRQSRLQWSIISVAPAGARFLFCFFFPWLTPWATFYCRYAACIRSLFFSIACPGQPNENERI